MAETPEGEPRERDDDLLNTEDLDRLFYGQDEEGASQPAGRPRPKSKGANDAALGTGAPTPAPADDEDGHGMLTNDDLDALFSGAPAAPVEDAPQESIVVPDKLRLKIMSLLPDI